MLVATFTDSDGNTNPGFYTATINWGDGSSSPGTVTYSGGTFQVRGTHNYLDEASYAVVVTIHDLDGNNYTVNSSVTVSDAALSWQGGSPSLTWAMNTTPSPTLTNPGTHTNAEGDTVSLQVAASDPNNYALTYDALSLPRGLSINSSTGLITGTIDYSDAESFEGNYTPTLIVANDHGGSTSATFNWTINDTHRGPTLTNPGNQTSARGSSVSLTLNATSPEGETLIYDATGLPSGLDIDTYGGVISGTPDSSAVSATAYSVTVTASDSVMTASQTFNWTITPANHSPSVTSPGSQVNAAGDEVELSVAGSDSDGDPITWTASGLPAGLAIDPDSGIITGTLAASAASTTPYTVSVNASDGIAGASQSFSWTVNHVGISSPGDQANTSGDTVSLPVSASSAGGTLTYSASGLPPGLSINSSSGVIAGTLSSTADAGSPYTTTVTASDGTHSASATFHWTVAHVSLTNPGDQTNREATAVSLQPQGSDADGDPLTWTATGLPAGLSLNSSTGLISGTLNAAAHGSSPYLVTVTASDGSHSASQSFVWTVTPRVALVNPGNQANASGDSVSLQVQASTVGGTLSYSATALPAGLSINSATGLISGTISAGGSSTPYAVTVTASDGTSSSSQRFAWTVATLLLVSPGDQTNLDGDSVSLSPAVHYHGGGTLSYTATGLPAGVSINTSSGVLSGTVANTADTLSPYSVTVTATAGGSSGSQTFNWFVNPRITLDSPADQANAAGDAGSLSLSATDAAGETLTWSASGLPSGLSLNSSSGVISRTIATGADTSSPYTVTVTAADAHASTSAIFNWTVAHVALANPGDQDSVDGDLIALALQGHDADGDPVTYTASGLPSGLSLNSSTGLISGVLSTSADQNSPYLVTVTASDGSHSSSQHFLWNVFQVGVANPGDQTNTEGNTVTLSVAAHGVGGTLTYSAGGLPAGLSLNTATGLISGTIAADAALLNPYPVTVAVSNGSVSSSQDFTWTVNPRVVLTPPAEQGSVEGNSVSLQVVASDTANAPLTYSAYNLPPGLSINSSSGLISGTISAGASSGGPYAVVVTASDGGYSSSDAFTWTVTATADPGPTLSNPGTQTNVTGDMVELALVASDVPGDLLSFSATGLPDGLALAPSTGIISGFLATDAASTTPYSVTVSVDNGHGGSASQTFSWIVNDAALTVQAASLSATEANDPGPVTVATFTTGDLGAQADDYTAQIDWGDGSLDSGDVEGGSGSFTVTGDHNYLEAGSYTVSVLITASGGSTASASSTASVADAALTLTGGFGLGVIKSQLSTLTVATFTDANPAAPASDFSATINWGDGTGTATGNVSYSPDSISSISGAHSYAQNGSYTVTVTLTDADGATATATSTVFVGDVYAGVPAILSVSSFVDAYITAPASDFTATIDWGDGTSTSGVQATGSGGIYTLQAVTHTYAGDSVSQSGGVYTVTVTISDDGGSTLAGAGTVAVVRPPLTLYVADTAPGSLSLSNAEVAAFTEPDTLDSSSEFSATIDWGDGTTSSGTVTGGGGLFRILGSHTYAYDGDYVLQVEVSQHWDTSLPAARGAGRVLAEDDPPEITGPHVVLGLSQNQFDRDPSDLRTFRYLVKLPGTNIDERSLRWRVDKVNDEVVGKASTWLVLPGVFTTWVWAKVTFLNTAAQVNLRLTYKRDGEARNANPHEVQPFPISIVELTVADGISELKNHPDFNPISGRFPRGPAAGVTTRPASGRRYDPRILEGPEGRDLEDQLDLGAVSFKAWVLMRGAGDNQTEGVTHVKLGWVQDVVATTVTVRYRRTGTATIEPTSRGRPLPGPWLDSDREKDTHIPPGNGGDSSFTRSSTPRYERRFVGGRRAGTLARFVSLDAVGMGFLVTNPESGGTWDTIKGGLSFVNHLTAYSTDADKVYVVLGRVPWSIRLDGSNPGSGRWTEDAANAGVKPNPLEWDFTGGPRVGALPAYGAQLDSFNPDPPTFAAATGTGDDRFTYKP